MKNLSQKMCVVGIILFAITFQSFAQAPMVSVQEGGKKPNTMEKAKIPTQVMATHIKECPLPTTMNEYWYGYPDFTNESDWYGYNYDLYSNVNPSYYIVTLFKDQKNCRIMYAKNGKKVATHRSYTSVLPLAIAKAIQAGNYKNWDMTGENEEIFKDKDSDQLKIYKVVVQKGTEKYALFYMADGRFLKENKIKL